MLPSSATLTGRLKVNPIIERELKMLRVAKLPEDW